jgi:Xaa-Pro aminopeptidase
VPEVLHGFPDSEFENRTNRAQSLMKKQNIDALLLTTEPEVRYFSGFHTLFWQSPTRPWFIYVPREGKPIAVIPEIGAELMRSTWLDDIRTWSAPNPSDDGITQLKELIESELGASGNVGIPMGHETHVRMPLADFNSLREALSSYNFVDATDIIRSLRMIKSELEIEKISYICQITSKTFSQADSLFFVGQTLQDSFREFKRANLANGADDVPYLVGGAGPGGYRDVISPPTNRPLEHGDLLMLDTGSVFDGYYCDFDRNFAIGNADDSSKYAYDILWRATEAGRVAMVPGATCTSVYIAMCEVIEELDKSSNDVGRLGHGLGMQLTEWPSLAAFDETILQNNMVMTLEPSISYGDGKLMVHEENLVIRDGYAHFLTQRATCELPVI